MMDTFPYALMLQQTITQQVLQALEEDIGSGDISSELIGDDKIAKADIISREEGIFCGKPWIEEINKTTKNSLEIEFFKSDGDPITADEVLVSLIGQSKELVKVERSILNYLQLLSGTATTTNNYVSLISNLNTELLDTRKTIPGMRIAQKYAVHCGGAKNHRLGLFDAFLLKENHIRALGNIEAAIQAAKSARPELPVEIEVENLEELAAAVKAGANMVLLDNFSMGDIRSAVGIAKGEVELEASGNITKNNIREIAETGVDYISTGAITKNIQAIDLSMLFTS